LLNLRKRLQKRVISDIITVLLKKQDRMLKSTRKYNTSWLYAGLLCTLFLSSFAQAQESAAVEPAALDAIGLRDVVAEDPSLTGQGIRIAAVCRSMTYQNGVALNDYRFGTEHTAFFGADVLFEDGQKQQAGVSSHATAIGGILLGLDQEGFNSQTGSFNYMGTCPGASVEVFEFWRFVSLYVFAGKPFKADIVTMSLGEIFPSWWTRGIERLAAERGMIIFAAAGNGKRVYDPVLYPAAGANVIAVGVINAVTGPDNSKSLTLFSTPDPNQSSTGPTADDRCKPDIVAPGRCLVPAADTDDGYVVSGDWSSLATPIAAGTASLLLQKARQEPELAVPMFASNTNNVIKAILLTSADKLPYWHKGPAGKDDDVFYPLDYSQGAGAVNALAAYNLMLSGWQVPGLAAASGWDNNVLDPNDAAVYQFHLADPANQAVRATLCWNRVYSRQFPFEPEYEQDSDLRLEFWAVDPNQPQRNLLLETSDSMHDNVEHIYFAADPNYTDYQLIVRQSVVRPYKQNYAIAWTAQKDTIGDNPFWYDLNNDGRVDDNIDKLIFFVLEKNQPDLLKGNQQMGLSSDRLQILKAEWPVWRKYLPRWTTR
jgi:hypothetical protein